MRDAISQGGRGTYKYVTAHAAVFRSKRLTGTPSKPNAKPKATGTEVSTTGGENDSKGIFTAGENP